MVGMIYVTAVFLTYLAAGFGLLVVIQKMPVIVRETLTWIVAMLVIVLGLIEIKDFWWYGKGISLQISPKHAEKIKQYVKKVSIPGAIFLGMFVAAVELPCTGGPYLAITTLLAKLGFTWGVFGLLVLYNFVFILPLLVILLVVYFGVHQDKIKEWKNNQKRWMRLFAGIVMILLGILLLLWSKGIIGISLS